MIRPLLILTLLLILTSFRANQAGVPDPGLTGSGTGQVDVIYGTMNDFILCGQPLHPMKTIISSLESLVLAYHYPLEGILGFDFFEKGIVRINLVKKEVGMCLNRVQRLSPNPIIL